MDQLQIAIQSIDNEITELQQRKEFLKSIDTKKVLNEDEWHELCQSCLRSNSILNVFVANIFPNATDIHVGPNYVKFTLYDINCYLPTSLVKGIEIDVKQFVKTKEPIYMDRNTTYISPKLEILNNYINANNWDEKSSIIIGNGYKKSARFILWHCKYKFKHKEYLEKQKLYQEEYDGNFEQITKTYSELVNKQKDMINIIKSKVIPELSKFTDNIRLYKPYITYSDFKNLDEILNYYD